MLIIHKIFNYNQKKQKMGNQEIIDAVNRLSECYVELSRLYLELPKMINNQIASQNAGLQALMEALDLNTDQLLDFKNLSQKYYQENKKQMRANGVPITE